MLVCLRSLKRDIMSLNESETKMATTGITQRYGSLRYRKTVAVAAFSAAFCALGDVYWFVGTDGASWQEKENYRMESRTGSVATKLPGGEDLVMAGSNSSASPANVDVPAEDNDFIAGLKGISVRNCTLTLNIVTNTHFACAVGGMQSNGAFSRSGTVVKKGAGDLYLDSCGNYVASGRPADYLCDTFAVSNGNVYLNKDVTDATGHGDFAFFAVLDIAAGSTFFIPSSGFSTGFYFDGLSGAGDISTIGAVTNSIYITPTRPCTFSGRITGHVKPYLRGGKVQTLDGTGSDTDQSFVVQTTTNYRDTTVAFTDGTSDYGASSSGFGANLTLEASGSYGPKIRYAGTAPGSLKKTIYCYSGEALTVDGGAFGGLTLENGYIWRRSSGSSDPGLARIIFTGEGAATNVENGMIFNKMGNATVMSQPLTIVKRGAGTWRFKNNGTREIDSVVAVDEGTLQFDTIAPVGSVCSLGYATHPYDPDYSTAVASEDYSSKAVGYHLRVGGGTTSGILEYTGTAAVTNDTRIVAVYGDGTLKNSSARDFIQRGVVTAGATASTLTIDCSASAGRLMVGDITNTVGTLSVVKTGSGEASIDGSLDFNGTLSVKDGTLIAGNRPNDTWFRFTIKNNHGGLMGTTYTKQIRISELALYSADGVRRNVGLVTNTVSTVTRLGEGQVAYLAGYDVYRNYDTTYGGRANGVASLFDESHGATAPSTTSCDWYCYTPGEKAFDPENENTWVVIAMRLPAGTPEIVAMDYVSSYDGPKSKSGTVPTSGWYATEPRTYIMESSSDGITWHTVYTEADTYANHVTKGGYWISSDGTEAFSAGAVRKLSDGKGLAFTARAVSDEGSHSAALENVAAISVARGASLTLVGDVVEVKGLEIDLARGFGSLNGATFANAGTLNLVGCAEPFRGTNVVMDLSGTVNSGAIAGWTLQCDGVAKKLAVRVTDAGLEISPPGLIVLFR